MNISGIRTGAGFYDYNSIKINEVRSQQIQEARESEQIPVTGTVESNRYRQHRKKITELPILMQNISPMRLTI